MNNNIFIIKKDNCTDCTTADPLCASCSTTGNGSIQCTSCQANTSFLSFNGKCEVAQTIDSNAATVQVVNGIPIISCPA